LKGFIIYYVFNVEIRRVGTFSSFGPTRQESEGHYLDLSPKALSDLRRELIGTESPDELKIITTFDSCHRIYLV